MKRRIALTAAGVLVIGLAFAQAAQATTFCVPNTSFTACPAGSTAQASLETAMQSNASDAIADQIFIAAGTQTESVNGTFETAGTDPLEIVGAGPGTGASATRLTSTGNANQFLLSLNSRPTALSDLTIVIPASFPNNQGAGLYVGAGGSVQNVGIESQNVRSDGVVLTGGSNFDDGQLYGSNAGGETGSIGAGFRTGFPNGPVVVTRATVLNPGSGASLTDGGQVFNLRRSTIVNPLADGVVVSANGIANVTNSVIQTDGTASALEISQFSNGALGILTARNVTAVRSGMSDTRPGVRSRVNAGVTGSTNLVVDDSIFRGYGVPFERNSGGTGSANLTIRYSDLPAVGTSFGPGSITFTNNIDEDPLFAGASDFHLLAGSPAIDAADPSSTVAEDFDGALRPADGNGDGIARNDIGAFEFPAAVVTSPGTQPPGTGPTPNTAAPKKKCKKRKKKHRAAAAKKKKCKKKRKR